MGPRQRSVLGGLIWQTLLPVWVGATNCSPVPLTCRANDEALIERKNRNVPRRLNVHSLAAMAKPKDSCVAGFAGRIYTSANDKFVSHRLFQYRNACREVGKWLLRE